MRLTGLLYTYSHKAALQKYRLSSQEISVKSECLFNQIYDDCRGQEALTEKWRSEGEKVRDEECD